MQFSVIATAKERRDTGGDPIKLAGSDPYEIEEIVNPVYVSMSRANLSQATVPFELISN